VNEIFKAELIDAIISDSEADQIPVPSTEVDLADAIRRHFVPLGGVQLTLPPREAMRQAPELE